MQKRTFKWRRGTAGKDVDEQREAFSAEGGEAEHKQHIELYLFSLGRSAGFQPSLDGGGFSRYAVGGW